MFVFINEGKLANFANDNAIYPSEKVLKRVIKLVRKEKLSKYYMVQ